jgi:signal transduction histidine kinase
MELSLNRINLDSTGRQRIAGTAHDLSYQKEQQSALIKVNQRLSDLQAELERLNEGLEQRVIEKTNSLQTAYVQLEEQHKKLQSLDQMKSDFVSMVSHELRAPLTNISGGIELILAGREKLNDRTRSSISLVQSEIQRLSRFVETILDLSALEAGRLPVFVEPISLNDIIQKTILHFSGSPDAPRISFSENDSLPPVLADPQTLASALFHVVDNALKYDPTGQVLVTTEKIGDNIQVLVRDHGPGIPEDVQPYIFEKFYRVNPVDSQSVYGHGLGLYMAEKMMNAMGGDIQVRNRADGGAEFTFSLPIVKE